MAKKFFIGNTELATSSDVANAVADKQDTLVSGTNIKTINNTSVLGSGNINIETGLTEVKASDIDSESATSGQVLMADGYGDASWQSVSSGSSNYNDLTNIPIVNQDLDDVGFTPVANTYYRHVGSSATTYAIGGIYYYDGTNYNAITGGGGTTSIDIIINGTTEQSGDSISFSSDFDYYSGTGEINVGAGHVVSGTTLSGDTLPSTIIDFVRNWKPLIINNRRFEFQDSYDVNQESICRYLSATMDGTLIKFTIAEINIDTGVITFIDNVVNDGMSYTTTAPSAPNTNGLMKLAVLSSDPATKYAGWLYYITQ